MTIRYALHQYEPGNDSLVSRRPSHEINVLWDEGDVRPVFLPPGAVIEMPNAKFWRVVTPILHVPVDNGESEHRCFSYLVWKEKV